MIVKANIKSPTSFTALPPKPATKPVQAKSGQKLTDAEKYAGRPIHLTATCKVNANASSGTNAQALHNPTGGPIEINLIKFGMNAAVVGGNGDELLGGALSIGLDLNGVPITNGYVPIWLFDKTINGSNEQLTGLTTSDYGEFAWYLPKPLWIGPDDQINATFQSLGMVSVVINARVSLSGRCLDAGDPPKLRAIPYASAYLSKTFMTMAGAADSDMSTETDLVNVTNDIVYVHRLTGRIYSYLGTSVAFTEGPSLANVGSALGDDAGSTVMQVQIYTGHGEPIVPYVATFRDVFCGALRSWEMGGMPVKPGDYVIVNLTKISEAGSLLASSLVYGQAQVGMSGYRMVAL